MNENDNEKISDHCFWCEEIIGIARDHSKCQEEFKEAIQNLFSGRQLSKQEAIKMRYSKR